MAIYYPNENEVENPSGRYVNIKDPQPETLLLEDIAHKLAQVNRWGGSARYPYSVAQHAVFVSRRVEQLGGTPRQQLLALHHDSAEAWLGDLPRPWKKLMGRVYAKLTERFDRRIAEALFLPESTEDDELLIKSADRWTLILEARHLMPSGGRGWAEARGEDWDLLGIPKRIITPNYWLGEIGWRQARTNFLWRHNKLYTEVNG